MTLKTPLSPTAFAVLAGLAPGPRSGVQIIDGLEEAGARILGPGSLYRLLGEMVTEGWVARAATEGESDGRVRVFGLTERGREVLDGEASRLGRMLRMPGVVTDPGRS